MAYKLFQANDILTAADVNDYLMEQAVMVFADASARDSALSSVLTDGQAVYLVDVDEFQVRISGTWERMAKKTEVDSSSVDYARIELHMEVI